MSSQATSRSESSLIGNPSNSVATSTGDVVYREFGTDRPLPLANTSGLASLVQEFEADPGMGDTLRKPAANSQPRCMRMSKKLLALCD